MAGKRFESLVRDQLEKEFPTLKGWNVSGQVPLISGHQVDFMLIKGNLARLLQSSNYRPDRFILIECKDVDELRPDHIGQVWDYRRRFRRCPVDEARIYVPERTKISREMLEIAFDEDIDIWRLKEGFFNDSKENCRI